MIIFPAVQSPDNEHMRIGIYRDCHGILDGGRLGPATPVQRIDAELRCRQSRRDAGYRFHGIVADSHPSIVSRLRGTDIRIPHIRLCHLVAYHISRYQSGIFIFVQRLQKFHHAFGSLAETGKNKRTSVIPMLHIIVESSVNILHGIRETLFHDFVRSPRIKSNLAIIRGIEVSVLPENIVSQFVRRQHGRNMFRIPHICEMADSAKAVGPVPYAGRQDIEDVSFRTGFSIRQIRTYFRF